MVEGLRASFKDPSEVQGTGIDLARASVLGELKK